MVRTQIQLTEEQSEKLKAAAAHRGISMAALIRQGIDAFLSRTNEPSPEETYLRAARAAGAHHSGTSDTASRHDDHLAEGFLP
jgi:predicted DNA-binding protein